MVTKNFVGKILPLSLVLASCGQLHPFANVSAFTETQLDGADAPNHTLSLTFDDGPGERTQELGDFLHAQGIQATFFMMGHAAQGHQNLLNRLRSQGHLIANHSFTHPHMPQAPNPVSEISQTDELIAPYVTNEIFLFRAPFADWTPELSRTLNATPLRRYVGSIYWRVDGGDWECWRDGIAPKECAQRYVASSQAQDHGPVLMHDSTLANKTVDMVKILIPEWKKTGYSFVRLDKIPSIQRAIERARQETQSSLRPFPCPQGFSHKNVGHAGGQICTNGIEMSGPFTALMRENCTRQTHSAACQNNRWQKDLGLALRGEGLCANGSSFDPSLRVCVEENNAFGPFSAELIEKCIRFGGGETECKSDHWNKEFLRSLLD